MSFVGCVVAVGMFAAAADLTSNMEIKELVKQGKYADAITAIDQRLAKEPDNQGLKNLRVAVLNFAKSASAVPATQPAAQASPPSENKPKITGQDRLEFDTIDSIATDLSASTDPNQAQSLAKELLEHTGALTSRFPDNQRLWLYRASAALVLEEKARGFEAGQKLIASGAMDSNVPAVRSVLTQLNRKGWLNTDVKNETYGSSPTEPPSAHLRLLGHLSLINRTKSSAIIAAIGDDDPVKLQKVMGDSVPLDGLVDEVNLLTALAAEQQSHKCLQFLAEAGAPLTIPELAVANLHQSIRVEGSTEPLFVSGHNALMDAAVANDGNDLRAMEWLLSQYGSKFSNDAIEEARLAALSTRNKKAVARLDEEKRKRGV